MCLSVCAVKMTDQHNNWGGVRPGAGRPKKPEKDLRKMKSMRATDDEWELIKEFSKIVKKDPERAKRMMKTE